MVNVFSSRYLLKRFEFLQNLPPTTTTKGGEVKLPVHSLPTAPSRCHDHVVAHSAHKDGHEVPKLAKRQGSANEKLTILTLLYYISIKHVENDMEL